MGAFNSEGPEPLDLTPATPDSALLATLVDPGFLLNAGLPPEEWDPSWWNIPIQYVGTNVDPADLVREALPDAASVPPWQTSKASPADPIYLETWKRARGVVSFECDDQGKSEFLLAARNLIPNRLYSLFGIYFNPTGMGEPILTPPFGGLPNAFVSDREGSGTIRRTLNGCPTNPPEPNEPVLLVLDLHLHSDHMLNGAHPSLPLKDGGLGVGAITHAQLEFPINGTQLSEPEGWGDDPCLPGNTAYCLSDGRFKAEVAWTDFAGNSGSARTLDFDSDDSGVFYFFNPGNKEVTVKVLNGCAFNDHYWVFASAATNVEYAITVTDTRTGNVRTYENELGKIAPAVTDTTAFATCP